MFLYDGLGLFFDPVHKVGYLCTQEEFAATRSQLLMYRRLMHDLIQTVAGRSRPQLFLDGPSGADTGPALPSHDLGQAISDTGCSSCC